MELGFALLHNWLMIGSGLRGKHILLTRAQGQLPELAGSVERRGGVPVLFPCLEVKMLPQQVRQGLSAVEDCTDILFTSRNGVLSVGAILAEEGISMATLFRGRRIAVVGGATADALHEHGIEADIIPQIASQDGLADAYAEKGLPRQLLFFRAREGREYLHDFLVSAGVSVCTVAAYETVCTQDDAADIVRRLQQGNVDGVLLGSAKAARCYVQRIGDVSLADRPAIAVLSEQVRNAAIAAGLSVQVVAERASFEALLDALDTYFAEPGSK